MVVVVCMNTSDRSEKMARDFWRLTALAFAVWLIPQAIGTFANLYHLPDGVRWLVNLLFCFWSVPLAFGSISGSRQGIERLGFTGCSGFCPMDCLLYRPAYFCFFYIPRPSWSREPIFSLFGMGPIFHRLRDRDGSISVARATCPLPDGSSTFRAHGGLPRPLGDRRRTLLLRTGTRSPAG